MLPKRTPLLLAGSILVFVIVAVWLVYFPAKPSPQLPGDEEDATQPIQPLAGERIKLQTKPQPTLSSVTVSPINAADLYRQAFALVGALSSNELAVIADWKSAVDPAVAAELCARLQPIWALAHEATTSTNCNWGVSHVTLDLPVPYLPASRSLANVLVWNAAHCRLEDSAGIADDLAATVQLGQNVVKPPFLISHLVNLEIQSRAIEYLASIAATLPPDVSTRLAQLLANDQSTVALASVWEADAAAFNGSADQFAALAPTAAQAALRKLIGDSASKFTQAQAVTALRLVAELETEYAQALTAPDPEYQTWLDRSKADQLANPLMDLLLPTSNEMDTVLAKTQTLAVNRALLLAGLAYLQGEPDALSNHHDPSSGDAFVMHQSDTGFDLQSTYQVKDAPLVMFFPKR